MEQIWSVVNNNTVLKYIINSTEFQNLTKKMICWYISFCVTKLYNSNNVTEWDLNSILFLKRHAQKCM